MKAKFILIFSILSIFNINTSSPVFSAQENPLISVTWSPDETKIAGAGLNGLLRVWDAATGEIILDFANIKGPVATVDWSPDGTRLVSNCNENDLCIWDVSTGKQLVTLQGHHDYVTSAKWSPNGLYIVSVSFDEDNTLRLWDAVHYTLIKEFWDGNFYTVAWSPSGEQIATASFWAGVKVYPMPLDFDEQKDFRIGITESMMSIAWHPNNEILALGAFSGDIYLWNLITNQQLHRLLGHQEAVDAVAWHPSGKYLASISTDKTIRLWDTQTGLQVGQSEHTNDGFSLSIEWNSEGTQLAYGGKDGMFKILTFTQLANGN